jgi:RimJ/RimL family protein N-acetyltransferase
MDAVRSAPTLTTPRLILRGHARDDFDRLFAIWTDPKVYQFIGGKPSRSQEVWFRLMRYMGHWPMLGFGYWAVVEAETGLYVGDVGLADFKRGLGPDFDGVPEAGWVLAPEAFGKGYATEAMTAILAWYEQNFGPQRSVCMIESAHLASIHVAEKLGYRPFRDVTLGDKQVSLFHRL